MQNACMLTYIYVHTYMCFVCVCLCTNQVVKGFWLCVCNITKVKMWHLVYNCVMARMLDTIVITVVVNVTHAISSSNLQQYKDSVDESELSLLEERYGHTSEEDVCACFCQMTESLPSKMWKKGQSTCQTEACQPCHWSLRFIIAIPKVIQDDHNMVC